MEIEEVFLHPTRQLVGSVSIRSGDTLRDWTGDREIDRDGLRDTYREPVSDGVFSLRLRLLLLRLVSRLPLLPETRLLPLLRPPSLS